MWDTHQTLQRPKNPWSDRLNAASETYDEKGPDQEEEETGETSMATFITIEDYDNNNGYEEEW